MMRIVVLGSGGAVPAPDRNLPSIAMRYVGDVYLFDCGEGTQRQMMKFGISYAKVKAIFLSHLHPDHTLGIPGLLFTLKMIERKEKVTIFGPKGTRRRFEGFLGDRIELSLADVIEIDDVASWKYEVEDGSFRAFNTNHIPNSIGYVFETDVKRRFDKEKCDALGIKGRAFKTLEQNGEFKTKDGKLIKVEEVTYPKAGKKVVYTGDTMYSDETVEVAKEADLLFHEANFMEEHRKEADEDKHSTALDAAKVAKESGAKKLVLFHISNRYKDMKLIEDEAKTVFENTVVARDGLELNV
jgi:ribonuclease Z